MYNSCIFNIFFIHIFFNIYIILRRFIKGKDNMNKNENHLFSKLLFFVNIEYNIKLWINIKRIASNIICTFHTNKYIIFIILVYNSSKNLILLFWLPARFFSWKHTKLKMLLEIYNNAQMSSREKDNMDWKANHLFFSKYLSR